MIITPAGFNCVFHRSQPVKLHTLDNGMTLLFCSECQNNLDSYTQLLHVTDKEQP